MAEPEADSSKEYCITLVDLEATCWGCGLRLLLPPNSSVFKCGWCGAITNQIVQKHENKYFWWRQLRDRSFVCILVIFMLFVICGGVWAVYPVVFSVSVFFGIFHSTITIILAATTVSSFGLAAFRCAGTPPIILWGSYPIVSRADLENYTFCHYCLKPKPPRAHHCRSCGMCIMDMDHHCPFIGNCVGAANHRDFVVFLISAVTSTIYVAVMSAYSASHMWQPVTINELNHLNGSDSSSTLKLVKEITVAVLRSTILLTPRGIILVYLFIASFSVGLGLGVLLWQQLCYIYEGKTYLSHLSSQASDRERDCQNFVQFFGCSYSAFRYIPNFHRKRHKKVKGNT